MQRMARGLGSRGIDVVTFNFAYTEAKRKRPDSNDVLEACWVSVLEAARAQPDVNHDRIFLGGKSMGGRIASQVAAAGKAGDIRGLVFLGYPLHPPSAPDKLRSAHLPRVPAPMLFVQGTRDAFGSDKELAPIVETLAPGSRIFPVEHGDHSFAVPKKAGVKQEDVYERILDVVAEFITDER
jgi:predicted alpha/beta-hydrolase family hydrolase